MLQVSIGKILCSLTSEDQYRKIILKNQVITQTLSTWKDSNVSYLKLLGRKILWNLSNPKEWIPDGIYIWTGGVVYIFRIILKVFPYFEGFNL